MNLKKINNTTYDTDIDALQVMQLFIECCSKENPINWGIDRNFDENILKNLKVGLCNISSMNEFIDAIGMNKARQYNFVKENRYLFMNRVIIPFSKTYFSARSQDRSDTKYKNLFPTGFSKQLFQIKGVSNKVYICEGETDAIRLKHIYPEDSIVSIGGAKSKITFNKIFKEYPNHEYIICFDNDEPGETAYKDIIAILNKKNINNVIKRLTFPKDYKDVDEYCLKDPTLKDLKETQITLECKQGAVTYGIYNHSSLNIMVQNKEDLADGLYKLNPYFYDAIGLFWFWNQELCCYEMIDEFQLMNQLKKIANNKNFQITESKFWHETIRSLKLIGRAKEPKPFKKEWIQFGKTIYDYKTKKSFASSPDYFNVNPIPFELGQEKETPTIDNLFSQWVGKDMVLTLKETIGLSLLHDYPLHRIICLFGRGLNGKGVFLRFLAKFIGKKNICSSNLKKIIGNNFESSKLYNKLACIMGETDFGILKDTSILKQLSGMDLVSAEYKGKNSFDFESYATLFIASNSMPITEDKTDGFYRRWLIIDFPNSFDEGKDPLETIPLIEFNNLCLQLLDVIPTLIERGRFDKDGSIADRKKKYEEKSNPLSIFISENYVKKINHNLPFYQFYDNFSVFCDNKGYRILSKKSVSKLLEENGFETEKKNVPVGSQYKQWVYILDIDEKSSNIVPIVPIVPMVHSDTYRVSSYSTSTIGTTDTKNENIEQNKLNQYTKEDILIQLSKEEEEKTFFDWYNKKYYDQIKELALIGEVYEFEPGKGRVLK
jgi:putative DNA primase/helicase